MELDIMLGKVHGKRRGGRQETRWTEGVTEETNKSQQSYVKLDKTEKAGESMSIVSPRVRDDWAAPNNNNNYTVRCLIYKVGGCATEKYHYAVVSLEQASVWILVHYEYTIITIT